MEKDFHAPKPVAAGEIISVLIKNTNGHGEGIADYNGFIIFIRHGAKGEKCRAKITDVKRTYATADKL